jgi:DNA polymerase gamma 1
VDYLHLLIISMDYLIRRFNLDARLAITVHDEIRYLVKNEDRYKAAMTLQVANVWTRAMFSQQMGIDDLPQSCAYFSAVDIDHVLRKEVNMDCVTPSHPNKIPYGESLDIHQLLAKGEEAWLDPSIVPSDGPIDVSKYAYMPRPSVMSTLNSSTDVRYLRAQITMDDKELKSIIKEAEKDESSGDSNNGSAVSRGRRPKPKVPPPPYAQPQRAVLLEVEDRWDMGYKKAFANSHKPGFYAKGPSSSSKYAGDEGLWEV